MDPRPIPAFYCCYLLRSTVRPSSLYVGSTPHPARRLAQHNGRIKGGAVKTSRESLRPWQMACIVEGFPSHVAALQFEWAWQNTHLTLRIPASQRITAAHTRLGTTRSTGRTRRRPVRPRASLTDKLANLHLLLRVDSFRRWPLEVRFFCEDVHEVFQRWSERVEGKIREGIKITLQRDEEEALERQQEEEGMAKAKRKRGVEGATGGVAGVDVEYASLLGYLEKSRSTFDREEIHCAVCRQGAHPARDSTPLALCPHGPCTAVSHLTCLSNHSLQPADKDIILPTEAHCPSCRQPTRWIDVVKELSLRMRGQDEVDKLLTKAQKDRAKAAKVSAAASKKRGKKPTKAHSQVSRAEEGELERELESESEDAMRVGPAPDGLDDILASTEEWVYREVEDGDGDAMSVTSAGSDYSSLPPENSQSALMVEPKQRLEIVIEDSEWDDAEVLD